MHFMSTLYYTTFLDFFAHTTHDLFENTVLFQLLFSAQLFWSPLLIQAHKFYAFEICTECSTFFAHTSYTPFPALCD